MHPLLLLAIATMAVVLAFAAWNYVSTRRRQKYGSKVRGMGGENDPLS